MYGRPLGAPPSISKRRWTKKGRPQRGRPLKRVHQAQRDYKASTALVRLLLRLDPPAATHSPRISAVFLVLFALTLLACLLPWDL